MGTHTKKPDTHTLKITTLTYCDFLQVTDIHTFATIYKRPEDENKRIYTI